MKTFIAYDKETYQIIGFIKNDYSRIEDTAEVFQNFENYEVIDAGAIDMPNFFDKYKVIIEEGLFKGIEIIEIEELPVTEETENNNESTVVSNE